MSFEDEWESKNPYDNDKWGELLNFIKALFVIGIIIASFLILPKYFSSSTDYTNEAIITKGTIQDLYRQKDNNVNTYYMMVKTDLNGDFDIEISQYEFIHYKTGDTVEIRIVNREAHLNKSLGSE